MKMKTNLKQLSFMNGLVVKLVSRYDSSIIDFKYYIHSNNIKYNIMFNCSI